MSKKTMSVSLDEKLLEVLESQKGRLVPMSAFVEDLLWHAIGEKTSGKAPKTAGSSEAD